MDSLYVYVKNKKSADGEEVFWNCKKRMSDKYKAIVHTKTGDMTKESTNITTPEMEHVVKSLVRETKSKKETRQLNKLH